MNHFIMATFTTAVLGWATKDFGNKMRHMMGVVWIHAPKDGFQNGILMDTLVK